MGGAFNIDRPQEIFVLEEENGLVQKNISNYPLCQDIDLFSKKLNALGEPIDIMITHGCPGGIGVGIKGHRCFVNTAQKFIKEPGHSPVIYNLGDVGEYPLTKLWNSLNFKPTQWIFGHYHTISYSYIDRCTFRCIGCCDTRFGNIHFFIYDTESNWLSEVKV